MMVIIKKLGLSPKNNDKLAAIISTITKGFLKRAKSAFAPRWLGPVLIRVLVPNFLRSEFTSVLDKPVGCMLVFYANGYRLANAALLVLLMEEKK